MSGPNTSVVDVLEQIGDKAGAIKNLGFIAKGQLANGYKELLSSKETPEESLQFAKDELAKAMHNGEISPDINAVMAAIINDAGTDSKRFASLVTANIDQITEGLDAPKIKTAETAQVINNEEDVASPETIQATTLPAVQLKEPDPNDDNNFLARLTSGEFDLEGLMDGLDFEGSPAQAIMGMVAMISAIFKGEDPQMAMAKFKEEQAEVATAEEDKNYETGPNGQALTTVVEGQDIGADTSAVVTFEGDDCCTMIAGEPVTNRFHDLSNPNPNNVKVVDPSVEQTNTLQQTTPLNDAQVVIGLGQ